MHYRKSRAWLARPILLLILLLIGAVSSAATRSGLAAEQTMGIVVVVWPTPSVQVARGDILAYQVQVKNFARNPHTNIRVYLPYDPAQLTILYADFDQPGGWVSELGRAHLVVSFKELAGGRSQTGTVYARVASDLPDDTSIGMWPSFSWRNSRTERPGNARRSNAAPVVVGPTSIASPFVWMSLTPAQGPAATTFRAFSDRFVPDEAVEAILVTPTGNRVRAERLPVNSEGQVALEIPPDSLTPGSYQLVLHGLLSNLQAVQPFVVE